MKLWWADNKAKKKFYDAKYHSKNRQTNNVRNLEYYYANIEQQRARQKVYNKVNHDKLLLLWQKHYHIRRAKLAGVKSELYTKQQIFNSDRGICYICKHSINLSFVWPNPQSFSFEHVVPLSKGGDDTPSNVRSAHLTCNIRKYNKLIEEI